MDILQRNLEVLAERNREAYEKVRETVLDETIELFKSKDGTLNIKLRGIPIHSTYSPRKEAERLADSVDGEFTVLGIGLGYHLEILISKGFSNFTVIEPSPKVLKAFLMTGDRRNILKKINISLGLGGIEKKGKLLFLPSMKRLYRTFINRWEWGLKETPVFPLDILVVGAIYGGTVPIAGYVAEALEELGHRVTLLNFEDFYSGYRYIKSFSSNPGFHRILLDRLTELLGDLVFMKAAEEKVDLVFAVAQAPLPPKILEKLRENGVLTAYWFTEDHQVMDYWRDIAPFYDIFMVIQEDEFLEELEALGVNYMYLPLACHPKIHRPMELSEEERARYGASVSFVGAGYFNRRNFFKALADLEDFKIWGSEWEGCWELWDKIQEGGRRVSTEECVKIFNATKININLHSSPFYRGINPHGDYVNPRTFEIASCGAFQLVDPRKKLPEFFTPGEEVVTFSSEKELRKLIKYYLNKEEEREDIAQRSREKALREHTYRNRMEAFLRHLFYFFGSKIRKNEVSEEAPAELEGVLKKLSERRVKNITPSLMLQELRKEKKNKRVSDEELVLMILEEIWSEALKKKGEFLWEFAGRFSS